MSADASLLAGRYELGERIGRGGQAAIHRARDTRMDRDVAVKIVRFSAGDDEGDIEAILDRFRHEVFVTGRLNHPNVVQVHDFGMDTGQMVAFMVMGLLEGRTLKEAIRRDGSAPVRDVRRIMRSLIRTLDYLHSNNVVHRDMKPSNIFLHHGEPVIIDFGISASEDKTATLSTESIAGSQPYICPELITRRAPEFRRHPRRDVWALGLICFELCTGRPLFDAEADQLEITGRLSNPSELMAEVSDRLKGHPLRDLVLQILNSQTVDTRWIAIGESAERTQTPPPPRSEPQTPPPPTEKEQRHEAEIPEELGEIFDGVFGQGPTILGVDVGGEVKDALEKEKKNKSGGWKSRSDSGSTPDSVRHAPDVNAEMRRRRPWWAVTAGSFTAMIVFFVLGAMTEGRLLPEEAMVGIGTLLPLGFMIGLAWLSSPVGRKAWPGLIVALGFSVWRLQYADLSDPMEEVIPIVWGIASAYGLGCLLGLRAGSFSSRLMQAAYVLGMIFTPEFFEEEEAWMILMAPGVLLPFLLGWRVLRPGIPSREVGPLIRLFMLNYAFSFYLIAFRFGWIDNAPPLFGEFNEPWLLPLIIFCMGFGPASMAWRRVRALEREAGS